MPPPDSQFGPFELTPFEARIATVFEWAIDRLRKRGIEPRVQRGAKSGLGDPLCVADGVDRTLVYTVAVTNPKHLPFVAEFSSCQEFVEVNLNGDRRLIGWSGTLDEMGVEFMPSLRNFLRLWADGDLTLVRTLSGDRVLKWRVVWSGTQVAHQAHWLGWRPFRGRLRREVQCNRV